MSAEYDLVNLSHAATPGVWTGDGGGDTIWSTSDECRNGGDMICEIPSGEASAEYWAANKRFICELVNAYRRGDLKFAR